MRLDEPPISHNGDGIVPINPTDLDGSGNYNSSNSSSLAECVSWPPCVLIRGKILRYGERDCRLGCPLLNRPGELVTDTRPASFGSRCAHRVDFIDVVRVSYLP